MTPHVESASPRPGRRRRFLAPEVVQTSAMDCGPAALQSLLAGFGVRTSYARLQEACRVDVDGTSINTIEELAGACGLAVDQMMLPVDHVLRRSARVLPALVVVSRQGTTHFVIVWRRHGPWVQIMDPARGRRWIRLRDLEQELYVHAQRVPAAGWREWASSTEALAALDERLRELRVGVADRKSLTAAALADDSWRGLATLDAAVRMTAAVARRGRRMNGAAAARLIAALAAGTPDPAAREALVPATYWSVLPDRAQPDGNTVVLRGAVLLAIRGVASSDRRPDVDRADEGAPVAAVAATIGRSDDRPLAALWRLAREQGIVGPALVTLAVIIAAGGALLEILFLRGMLDLGQLLALREQRLVVAALLVGTVVTLSALDAAIAAGVLRIGRGIDARLRVRLLAKLPRLRDEFFRSRLLSDMALRAHSLEELRRLPESASLILRTGCQLVLTAAAIGWLDPPSRWMAATAAGVALLVPFGAARLLAERDLRQRIHGAALSRLYLDSLVGLVAARVHGGEAALRHRHETQLVEWARAGLRMLSAAVVVEGVQLLAGLSLAAWLVLGFVSRGGEPGAMLLFVFWTLSIPMLGRDLAAAVRRLPAARNIARRVLELLSAPEQSSSTTVGRPAADARTGVHVAFDDVEASIGGRAVLTDVNLTIEAGEHVAVVGRSGAGKSTLIGLLLGWHAPSRGVVRVNGEPLVDDYLIRVRLATAWVDPGVQLWNRSLLENLRYGADDRSRPDVSTVIDDADLFDVLQKLPAGLQAPLGEGGRLTSGGEGQRVRFGRALGRPDARLVLLDEPFRGLDRATRQSLLGRARERWSQATLVAVTHDIRDTLVFDRVVVVEDGRVAEDDAPATLAAQADSLYARLLAAERAVEEQLFGDAQWRRWRIQDGALVEETAGRTTAASTDVAAAEVRPDIAPDAAPVPLAALERDARTAVSRRRNDPAPAPVVPARSDAPTVFETAAPRAVIDRLNAAEPTAAATPPETAGAFAAELAMPSAPEPSALPAPEPAAPFASEVVEPPTSEPAAAAETEPLPPAVVVPIEAKRRRPRLPRPTPRTTRRGVAAAAVVAALAGAAYLVREHGRAPDDAPVSTVATTTTTRSSAPRVTGAADSSVTVPSEQRPGGELLSVDEPPTTTVAAAPLSTVTAAPPPAAEAAAEPSAPTRSAAAEVAMAEPAPLPMVGSSPAENAPRTLIVEPPVAPPVAPAALPPRLAVGSLPVPTLAAPAALSQPTPVARAPAATVAVAELSAADQAIRRVLALYERSYDELDAGSVAAVWRGLDHRGLERAFGTLASQDLAFDRCDLNINGSHARAECRGALRFVPRIGSGTPQERSLEWTFHLEQDDGRWHIETVSAR